MQRKVQNVMLSFIDVRNASVHISPARTSFVTMPRGMCMPANYVARLDACMYGTRDAGMLWEMAYADALRKVGVVQGTASPCCVHHPSWGLQ